MVVGVHGIGKTTLLDALRREGQGSYRDPGYQSHFNDRRRSRKCKSDRDGRENTLQYKFFLG